MTENTIHQVSLNLLVLLLISLTLIEH